MTDQTQTAVHYSEFSTIMENMLAGYVDLVRQGKPDQTIAFAMMGATLNFYDMFGLNAGLPQLLRSIADRIEDDSLPN